MGNKNAKGIEYMREIARRGGLSTKRKFPEDHFKEIGRKGGRPSKKVEDGG